MNAVVGTIQPDNNEKLQTYPAAAQQSAAREDFSAAVTAYKRAVEADPQTAGFWTDLGLMYHETGNFHEALGSLTGAARLKPSLYVPKLSLVINAGKQGRPHCRARSF